MDKMKNICPECKKIFNIDKKISANCMTCNKKYMCVECCYTHDCLPGKPRQIHLISNPEWVVSLKKSIQTKNQENIKSESKKEFFCEMDKH